MKATDMPKCEIEAKRIIELCVEHALVSAECVEDKNHPCVIIWSPVAIEFIGAELQRIFDSAISSGIRLVLEAQIKTFENMPLKSLKKEELLEILKGECANQAGQK